MEMVIKLKNGNPDYVKRNVNIKIILGEKDMHKLKYRQISRRKQYEQLEYYADRWGEPGGTEKGGEEGGTGEWRRTSAKQHVQ